MPETRAAPVAMRVETAAADPQHRTLLALRGQGVGTYLAGHRGRMAERRVEGVGADVQSGLGRAIIGGAQRVELLDGAVGVDHDQRARRQAQPLDRTRVTQYQLVELGDLLPLSIRDP